MDEMKDNRSSLPLWLGTYFPIDCVLTDSQYVPTNQYVRRRNRTLRPLSIARPYVLPRKRVGPTNLPSRTYGRTMESGVQAGASISTEENNLPSETHGTKLLLSRGSLERLGYSTISLPVGYPEAQNASR
jgi:hypothetical protein